ncbi:CDP-glycerol--glycerophosphate glycerophosphotransferase [Pseudoalteromonas piratica]|uniref:CDP-glycerol:glycerophosphate glycerophosphotransferase n=1 Tax=Pseudoalteromonas piratica TaxID=1348114 RepID=A0A0A7EHD7_9GAMM|nr:CDP-glycerol--glycerophosphate glycerophosphotransferase [Pseudoalteromonas piratica]AIY65407.1 CDP-glycerol:glycerophosphate glycerophosphotransferase [Pseudoalteromonas piratica]
MDPGAVRKYLFFISQNYSYAILRPLQQEIIRRGDEVAWFLWGDEVNARYLKENERHIKTVDDVKVYHPDAVFVPGNMVPRFFPGLKVAVFHGFDAGKLNRRGKNDHFNIRQCFDLYCTQGPNTTSVFSQLAKKHGYFNVVETGWPTLDPLFDKVEGATSKANEAKTKKTVLMCSTFSRNLTCAPHLFEQVKKESATGEWQWLVQFHPKMPKQIIQQYKTLESEHLTFVETDNVLPLLKQADVMLCDTSSVIQMFIVQNKPVVTFNNIDPQPHMVNFTDPALLAEKLDYALKYPACLQKNVSDYIQQLHPYRDGNSSARVLEAVEQVLQGHLTTAKKKPLNLLRNLKLRKKLNYWKFN